MTAFFSRALALAIAFVAFAAFAGMPSAEAAPGAGAIVQSGSASNLVKVRDTRAYRSRSYRHHPRYRRGRVVHAPFARVETGRRTVVDAPFVHVYKGRRGKHIVAPFVDMWR